MEDVVSILETSSPHPDSSPHLGTKPSKLLSRYMHLWPLVNCAVNVTKMALKSQRGFAKKGIVFVGLVVIVTNLIGQG